MWGPAPLPGPRAGGGWSQYTTLSFWLVPARGRHCGLVVVSYEQLYKQRHARHGPHGTRTMYRQEEPPAPQHGSLFEQNMRAGPAAPGGSGGKGFWAWIPSSRVWVWVPGRFPF
jgi:hypothetical protein